MSLLLHVDKDFHALLRSLTYRDSLSIQNREAKRLRYWNTSKWLDRERTSFTQNGKIAMISQRPVENHYAQMYNTQTRDAGWRSKVTFAS